MNDRDQTFLDQQRRLHIAKASRRNQEDSSATINNSNPVNATGNAAAPRRLQPASIMDIPVYQYP